MALSTRELMLVLRARDDASRTLNKVSGNLLRMGAASQTAALRAQAGALRQAAANQRLAGASKQEVANTLNAAKAYDEKANKIEKTTTQTRRLSSTMRNAGKAMTSVGVALAAVGAIGIYGLKQLVDANTDYQKSVALTKTQTDGFKASLKQLGDIGLNVAKNVAVPFEQIQPALYDIFSSTDANLKQGKILLNAFAKAAVAGQVKVQEAAQGTMTIMNAYNIPLEKVNSVLDVQFQLVRKGVGTYGQFAKVYGQVVPSATRAGQSFETVAAMLSYLTRNGLSASRAATTAARALDAFSNPKAIDALKELGVNAQDANGKMKPLATILEETKKRLDAMPAPDRVKALVNIFKGAGGTIQARRFIDQVLLKPGELKDFENQLKSMQNASGQFAGAYGTMSKTVASKTQQMKNQWKVFEVNAGQALTPVFTMILTWGNKLLKWFNDLSPHTKDMLTKFAAIAAAGAVLGGILLAVVGAIVGFVGSIISIVGAIAGAPEIFAALAVAIPVLIAQIGGFVAAIIAAWKNSKSFREIITKSWAAIVNFIKNVLIPAFTAFMNYVKNVVIPIVTKVVEQASQGIIEAFHKVEKGYAAHKTQIDKVISVLKSLGKQWLAVMNFIITKVVPILGPVLKKIFSGVGDNINLVITIISGLVDAITAVVNGFKWFINMAKSVGKAIGSAFTTGWNAVSTFFTKTIPGWIASAVGWWNSLPGKIGRALLALPGVLAKAGSDALNTFAYWIGYIVGYGINIWATLPGKMRNVAVSAWNAVVKATVDGYHSVIKWFGNLITSSEKLWTSFWSWVGKKTSEGYHAVINWFQKLPGAIRSRWNSAIAGAEKVIVNGYNRFVSYARSLPGRVGKALGSLGSKIRSAANNAYHSAVSAGENLGRGLLNGLGNFLSALYNKAKDLAKSALRGFLDGIHAKSPSRLFMKVAHDYIGGGIVIGLDRAANGIVNRAAKRIAAATNAFGEGPVVPNVALAASSASGSKTLTQSFVINTQEINPRKHAADLGWELARRM